MSKTGLDLAAAVGPLAGSSAMTDDAAAFHEFRFHQLVALMELRRQDRPAIGQIGDPALEYLRFRAARSLSFGPSDIRSVTHDAEADRLELRVNFFGLYGPSSPLPPAFTEAIIEADLTPDPVEDFLDLFNHRLISLLHVIWRKNRYYLRYAPGGSDALSQRFLALCGFPIEDRSTMGSISRAALLPHMGLISLFSNSADVVGATLSNFFAIPCRIEEFIARTVDIPETSQLCLGVANNQLSEDAILGVELSDSLGKFRIHIGQADFHRLARFLPHGSEHRRFCDLLTMVTREPLDLDLMFDFIPETVPQARLGASRLGWSSWLSATASADVEHAVVIFIDPSPATASGTDGGLQ